MKKEQCVTGKNIRCTNNPLLSYLKIVSDKIGSDDA